jgi:hypothetical protein
MSSTGIGAEIYEGASSFGVFMAKISLIVAIIIFVVVLIVIMFTKEVNWVKTSGTVTNVNCQTQKDSGFKCILEVSYKVGDKDVSAILDTYSPFGFNKGDSVDFYYDPENLQNLSSDKPLGKWKNFGIVAAIGAVIIGLLYFWYYVVSKYKFAAAGSGVASVWNMIR